MIIVNTIVVFFSFFVFYFREFYFSELAISFLPYIIFIIIALIVFSFLKFRRMKYGIKKLLLGLSVFCLGFLFLIYSREFNSFYDGAGFQEFTGGNSLDILYANINRGNEDYEDLKNNIEKYDPDLIMFVEFGEKHYDNLKDFLKEKYPYINSTTWSKMFIGSMVFSKYPIENWADDFSQGTWRYAYFQLKFEEKDYYIYLVHTSSPDNYDHFELRNKQLDIFLNDFGNHQYFHSGRQDNVLIVGDFNMSPWSFYYKNFKNGRGSGFVDISNKIDFLFTWNWKYLPVLGSHIDHFWMNFEASNIYMEKVYIKGSDHYGFLSKIAY